MAELLVVYDQELQIATVVCDEPDQQLTPTMVGPESRALLESFIQSMPIDLTMYTGLELVRMWENFLGRNAEGINQALEQATGAAEPAAAPAPEPQAALAQAEAVSAGAEPPQQQPADSDLDAAAAAEPTVTDCPNCGGKGTVADGEGGALVKCGMCNGTGRVSYVSA